MGYEELKAKQSVVWGTGPYQRITETITDIHDVVVDRLGPGPGDEWLDLACGTGAVAERAAAAGANVTGIDLAPKLIETAKERAGELGLDIDYRVGDAERLDAARRELRQGLLDLRDHVHAGPRGDGAASSPASTKPGGKIALVNWTPTGGLAKMFAVMAPYMPAPPPSSPFAWGDEEARQRSARRRVRARPERARLHAPDGVRRGVLGALLHELRADEDPRGLARRPARGAPPRLGRLLRENYSVDGEIVHTREYLLVLGTRR